jgi:hypothetical protein
MEKIPLKLWMKHLHMDEVLKVKNYVMKYTLGEVHVFRNLWKWNSWWPDFTC